MVFRLLRPDSISVWEDVEIIKRFSRYKGIIDGNQIARYLIAKSVECKFDANDSVENLEKLLNEKSFELREILNDGVNELQNREVVEESFIHLAEL